MFSRSKSKKKTKDTKGKQGLKLQINSPGEVKHRDHMASDSRASWGIKDLPNESRKMLEKSGLTKDRVVKQSQKVFQAMNAVKEMEKMAKNVQAPLLDQSQIDSKINKLTAFRQKNPFRRFFKVAKVGEGSGGVVFKVRDSMGKISPYAAVKVSHKKDVNIELIKAETAFQAMLEHPNIVRYFSTYEFGDEICIVMEYLDYTLIDILPSNKYDIWPEPHIAFLVLEILKGLNCMHSQNIIHRDIKSDNILVSKRGDVKLADFGYACALSKQKRRRESIVGTHFWMSPELIEGTGYSDKNDIWGLGIVILEVLDMEPPHMNKEKIEALLDVLVFDAPLPQNADMCSKDFIQLITRMLTKDKNKRASASELLQLVDDGKFKFFQKAASKSQFVDFLMFMKDLQKKRRLRNLRMKAKDVALLVENKDD